MGALGGSGRKISCIFWYMLDTMLSPPLDASEAAVPAPLPIMFELVALSLSGILLRIELQPDYLFSHFNVSRGSRPSSQALHSVRLNAGFRFLIYMVRSDQQKSK